MDDGQELTPWQEINPQGLGAPQPPRFPSSNGSTETRQLDRLRERLRPAASAQIVAELTPCLAQVAPSGMSQSDRDEWLMAAGQTLSEAGLPFDLLQRGCKAARHNSKVDHPSRIVAAILEDAKGSLTLRRDALRDADIIPPARRVDTKYCTGEEASAILAEFGLQSAFRVTPGHTS